MLSVTTLKDHISADVKLDLPEMETTVQVNDFFSFLVWLVWKARQLSLKLTIFLSYRYVYTDKKCSPSQEIAVFYVFNIFAPSRLPRVDCQWNYFFFLQNFYDQSKQCKICKTSEDNKAPLTVNIHWPTVLKYFQM